MRLVQYLNEGRSKPIDEENAKKFIQNKCSDFLDKFPITIFRGLESFEDFLYINPSKFQRKSANTSNYYTLYINNHPS
jgi:hypothetical protein